MKRFFVVLLFVPISGFADSIHFNDLSLDHVYIMEGKSFYYVNNPLDGSTKHVKKTDTQKIAYSKNAEEREELKKQWHAARGDKSEPTELKALSHYLNNRPKYTLITAKGTRKSSPEQTAQARANIQRAKQNALRFQRINPNTSSRALSSFNNNNRNTRTANNSNGNGGGQFTNISQLFSTFDDTLVGEFPNLIVQATQGGQGGQGGQGAQGSLGTIMGTQP